jgi:nucleotide-binding universal stress UspA family protein
MKILIPVDGSEYTKRAINYLFDHRAFFDLKAEITLLNVRRPPPKLVAASVRPEVIEEHDSVEVEKSMGWARKKFEDSRLPFVPKLEFGDPGKQIIEHAQKENVDLIIMGSRGHGSVPGMLVGSTTFKVLGACKVPVLVVR